MVYAKAKRSESRERVAGLANTKIVALKSLHGGS